MTVRIGLVGCGRWGRLILRDLLALGVVVDVVARSAETRDQAIALGASTASAKIQDLADKADGYVVAPPTITHAAVVTELLSTGRPIFVEKPMTSSLPAARDLVAAAGDRIFVMDKWRYHEGIEAIAAMAKAGELGDILCVRTYRLGWGNPHSDVDAAWILLPHDLAIAYEILGYLPPASHAFGLTGQASGSDVIAVLADGQGPKVVAEIGSSHPVNRRSVLVIGTRRCAQLGDSYDDKLLVADSDGHAEPRLREIGTAMPLSRELEAFLTHLQGGPPPRSSAAEGLLVVERIAALRRLAGLPA